MDSELVQEKDETALERQERNKSHCTWPWNIYIHMTCYIWTSAKCFVYKMISLKKEKGNKPASCSLGLWMPSRPNPFVVLISSLEENGLCKSEISSVTLGEPYHLQSTQKAHTYCYHRRTWLPIRIKFRRIPCT